MIMTSVEIAYLHADTAMDGRMDSGKQLYG